MPHKRVKQFEFLRRHTNVLSLFCDTTCRWVQSNVTHTDTSVWGVGRCPEATDRGAQTRTQLRKLERLGDIVVCSRVQRLDLILFLISHGKHENREEWMCLAYAPAGFHAANTRHVYVQQDRFTFALLQREECFFAAGCLTRTKSYRFKRIPQTQAQCHVVFDNQYRAQCCHVCLSVEFGIAMTNVVPV